MSNNFSFPPPPPPPPQRSQDAFSQPPRGRGNSGGSFRGRGASRGSSPRGGSSYGGRGRGNNTQGYQTQRFPPSASFDTNYTPKRTYAAAFSSNANPRPHAAPAVPSFNAGIENLLPPKPPTRKGPTQQSQKTNLLGLTPNLADASDSEDDKDEESRLAGIDTTQDLQFEYKGQTSALRTTAEIAAWIAERRKRWPTEAKREAARKEAAEKKRQWEETKKQKAASFQAAKQKRLEDCQKTAVPKAHPKTTSKHVLPPNISDSTNAAQLRAERLRRKAAKAQRDLEAAETALLQAKNPTLANSIPNDPDVSSDDSMDGASDSSAGTDLDSSTSSEFTSDSDSAPEESSSKIEVEKLAGAQQTASLTKNPCQFFAKHGKCKFGARCDYAHDKPSTSSRPSNRTAATKSEKKGLWQVMVEKEQEAERKKVLHAIIALGKQGILDAPL